MASTKIRLNRIKREIEMLARDPPQGIQAWPKEDCIDEWEAMIEGPSETCYENGLFKLSISVPANYPNDPPVIRFITPIYHPNIDDGGRICLSILNSSNSKDPSANKWSPAVNLSSALISIRVLLSDPNPDDPLMVDIAEEFRNNRELFYKKAREQTRKYATQQQSQASSAAAASSAASSREEKKEESVPQTKNSAVKRKQPAGKKDDSSDDDSSDDDDSDSEGETSKKKSAAAKKRKVK